MNEHHALCRTPEWAQWLQSAIIPKVLDGVDLGDRMIEVGPGPGAATDYFRQHVRELVAVEIEAAAAAALRERFPEVQILHGDATSLPFPDGSFDAAGTFTMLHHVPTAALQNTLLAEVLRVLRPGGVLVGSDSVASDRLHHFHEADTYNPLDPGTLYTRLATLGYDRISLGVDETLTFRAYKPVPAAAPIG
jgi:ubiquinone/menaquinone biosynthesis C-methylase UbiE